jgi:hypothetical protein
MKSLQILKNFMTLFYLKRNKVITTCLKNDIPLTDNNIKEVIEILNHKEKLRVK